ncbi:3-deoxy-D-manno-octulosonic acid transferase [Paracoccus sp. p4-l81]|uniref:3-deoxy-D-manno-octulosonic acid transferase n=1 Tax=Paracoccus sp. p4-l81 TaxID=3342806 RepID=UPI0035B7FE0D
MILYRLFVTLAAPVILIRLLWRVLRGDESWGDLGQRLGRGVVRPEAAVIWLHAASNGELASVRGLVRGLAQARPDVAIVVSTNSVTGRALAAGWPEVAQARLAPLDLGPVVRGFVRRLAPDLAIVVENELWPNRLAALAAQAVPVAVVGARMSATSARRWARLGRLTRRVLRAISLLSPQDPQSGARFAGLGLAADRIAPVLDLKAGLASGTASPMTAARARVVLGASTHPGDELRIARAWQAARARHPDLRLILAPRHPLRAPAILADLAGLDLHPARHSTGGDPAAALVLADTLGEMPRWYDQAGLCIIGGSFDALGGHTPYEPTAAGAAVLHGPDMANFRAAAQALSPTGAAVSDGDDLARRMTELAGDATALGDLAAAQAQALALLRGDQDGLLAALLAMLPPTR